MKKIRSILLFILLFNILIIGVNAYTNTYPYKTATHCGCEGDEWGFYKRQCTSYVAWKLNEVGVSFSNGMKGPNGLSGWFGNANNWDNNAQSIGFQVSNTPIVGSVAVWEANSGGAGGSGHVGWVESVNTNNTVTITEYNWNYGNGEFNTRYNRIADKYIIFSTNSCSGQNVILQNKTVNSGTTFNCNAGSEIRVLPTSNFFSGSNTRLFVN